MKVTFYETGQVLVAHPGEWKQSPRDHYHANQHKWRVISYYMHTEINRHLKANNERVYLMAGEWTVVDIPEEVWNSK